MTQLGVLQGIDLFRGCLDRPEQEALAVAVAAILDEAPAFRPTVPRTGTPFSVRMTNCGSLGWLSDTQGGYRYASRHPETGRPWPAMPAVLLELWDRLTRFPAPPEACLVNLYDARARMGLHRDFDEQEERAPVLSISLGASARFRVGGLARQGPTRSVVLTSGDVVLIGGPGRLAFHGIDRIYPGTSTLLSMFDRSIERINLTLRRVSKASARLV